MLLLSFFTIQTIKQTENKQTHLFSMNITNSQLKLHLKVKETENLDDEKRCRLNISILNYHHWHQLPENH